MSGHRLAAFGLVGLLLVGCVDLDTRYGVREGASVNGVRILHARLGETFDLVSYARIGSRAAERDLLIHVSTYPGLPDPSMSIWLRTWLQARAGRQVLLVLRDGNLAPWLCRRWAEEALAEARQTDGERSDALREQAARLKERASFEDESDLLPYGMHRNSSLIELRALPERQAGRIHGLLEGIAPGFCTSRSQLVADMAQPLISFDDRPWAISLPVGGSRMVICANALPLLDAAQVDGTCRRLLPVLLQDLADHGAQRASWLDHLTVRGEEEVPPPNILARLFGNGPVAWVSWHLLALALVFLAVRSFWLGRIETPPRGDRQRFAKHIEALAWHLRRSGSESEVVAAVARALGRPPAELAEDVESAFAAVGDLYRRAPPAGVPPPRPEQA